jgi:hypothetical protein
LYRTRRQVVEGMLSLTRTYRRRRGRRQGFQGLAGRFVLIVG